MPNNFAQLVGVSFCMFSCHVPHSQLGRHRVVIDSLSAVKHLGSRAAKHARGARTRLLAGCGVRYRCRQAVGVAGFGFGHGLGTGRVGFLSISATARRGQLRLWSMIEPGRSPSIAGGPHCRLARAPEATIYFCCNHCVCVSLCAAC